MYIFAFARKKLKRYIMALRCGLVIKDLREFSRKVKGGIGLRRKIFYGDCYIYLLSVVSIRRKF